MLRVLIVTGLFCTALASAAFASGNSQSPDPVRGKAVFARCMVCHDLNSGANRIGPSLKGVLGRKAGSYPGYAYSAAMKGKGVIWTAANLNTYLANPAAYVPGNKMTMTPLGNLQDRTSVIAYLQQTAR